MNKTPTNAFSNKKMCSNPSAIYLDSTAFFDSKFNFLEGPLLDLEKLAFEKGVELWCSDIVVTEVQIAIREKLKAISLAIEKAENVLRYSKYKKNFNNEWLVSAYKEAITAMEKYFFDADIKQLCVEELDESHISEVFHDFANRKRCFSGGKKRHEFPDAFQVALITQNVMNHDYILVVSGDGDFIKAFEGIEQIKVITSIQKAMELIT